MANPNEGVGKVALTAGRKTRLYINTNKKGVKSDEGITWSEITLDDFDGIKEPHAIRDGERIIGRRQIFTDFGVYRVSIGESSYIIKVREDSRSQERLHLEAKRYRTNLRDLQGTVVPKFYGLFEGPVGDGGARVSCIVLEDCGDNVVFDYKSAWDKVEESMRVPIAKVISQVHLAGLVFNVEYLPTIILKDNSYIMVKFASAREHECDWCGDLRVNQKIRYDDTFGCENLYCICNEMRLWPLYDYQRLVNGRTCKVSKTCPPQDLVDKLFPKDFERNADTVYNYERVFLQWLEEKSSDISEEEFVKQHPLPSWRKAHPEVS